MDDSFYGALKKLTSLTEWRAFEKFLDCKAKEFIDQMMQSKPEDLTKLRDCANSISGIKASVKNYIKEVEESRAFTGRLRDSLRIASLFIFLFSSNVFSIPPDRRSLSDVNFSNFKSTFIISREENFQNLQVATGVIQIDTVFVSSPGVNSQLLMYDSNKWASGNSTKAINTTDSEAVNGDNTNTYGEIPYHHETSTQGWVWSSTCSVCASSWSPPRLRGIFRRVR